MRKERGVYVFDMWIPKLPLIDSGDMRSVQFVEHQEASHSSNSANSDFTWLDDEAM